MPIDTTFRELIWRDTFLAGDPVGAVGEFYRDFGFPGVIVSALALGILAGGRRGIPLALALTLFARPA